MVEEPGGDLWMNEDIKNRIRARLWRSWSLFEQTLKDIQIAINDMNERLGSGGDVRWSDTSVVAKELKRAGFTLRRSTYDSLLATVKDGISNLESLATMNIELEPKRRVRSHIRLLNIIHNLSSSVYRAISSSLTCACKHSISMRVSDCMDDLTPSHDEEYVIQKLQVHLAVSLTQSQIEESLSIVTNKQWEELLIRASLPLQSSAQIPNMLSNTAKQIICSTKQRKSVKFSLSRFSSSSTTTMVQTETSLVTNFETSISLETTVADLIVPITQSSINICGELKKSPVSERSGCLGVISDRSQTNTRSYTVYPSNLSSLGENNWRMVSLKDSLETRSGQTPPTYKQRLQLAVFVARSVLQFYKTPWLHEMPSSRDIYFIQSGSFSYYDRPFLMAKNDKVEGKSKAVYIIQNPTLLAIGVLLIELHRGQTIESLQVPEERLGDDLYPLSIYMTAQRLLGDVFQTSSNYGSAVRRCIDGEFQGKDINLEDEDVRHDVYCGVVALLEEDL
ncbi:Hypothetical protein TRIVIDRAFT_3670, partial [Trichoderma virens Gv29-8]